MPKVKKGGIVTNVTEKNLNVYLESGWELVKDEPKPQPKTYDDYTKPQLIDIGKSKRVLLKRDMRKDEMIRLLNKKDSENKTKPTNKGFTDNLIK